MRWEVGVSGVYGEMDNLTELADSRSLTTSKSFGVLLRRALIAEIHFESLAGGMGEAPFGCRRWPAPHPELR